MNRDNSNRLIWLNNEIVLLKDAKINVLAPTAQFGANVFEGVRCYWNFEKKQLYAFRLNDHYKRLKNSIKMFRMEDKYTLDELKQSLIDVIRANGYKEDIAVRQTIFVDGFGSWFAKGPVNMFIAPVPKSRILDLKQNELKCCVSSWERISDKNISPRVKVGANYINSRMAQMEALQNGYDSAIFMNSQGKISEGPGSCLFIINDGILVTPSKSSSILESITRDTIIQLAKNDLGLVVEERDVERTELYTCDEAFFCGSAMEVVPIISVDGINVGKGVLGKCTQTIHKMYINVAIGENDKYLNWLEPIY